MYLSRASISWSSTDKVKIGISIETANTKSISCNMIKEGGVTCCFTSLWDISKADFMEVVMSIFCTQLPLTIHLPLFWLQYILSFYRIILAFNMNKSTYIKGKYELSSTCTLQLSYVSWGVRIESTKIKNKNKFKCLPANSFKPGEPTST